MNQLDRLIVEHQAGLQQLAPKCTSTSLCNMHLDEAEWGMSLALPGQDLVHEYRSVRESIATWGDHEHKSSVDSASFDEGPVHHHDSLKSLKTAKEDHEVKNISDSTSSSVEQLCLDHIGFQMRPRRSDISVICTPPEILYEHLFYKIVTPSDVGKLNRLVIPKQNAERYFPLHPSYRKRGLLLCFRDHNTPASGKLWWFRYSYWSSSQSYVLTKGWIRFVKEKHIKAGDIISFERGVIHDEFYISCRRRPTALEGGVVLSNGNHALPQATNSSTHHSTSNDVVSSGTCRLQAHGSEAARSDLPAYPELPAEALTHELYNCRTPRRSDMLHLGYTSCQGQYDQHGSLCEHEPWEGQGEVINRVADPLNSISEIRLFGVDLRHNIQATSAPKVHSE